MNNQNISRQEQRRELMLHLGAMKQSRAARAIINFGVAKKVIYLSDQSDQALADIYYNLSSHCRAQNLVNKGRSNSGLYRDAEAAKILLEERGYNPQDERQMLDLIGEDLMAKRMKEDAEWRRRNL